MQIKSCIWMMGLLATALIETGCASSFIKEKEGAEKIAIVNADEVSGCLSKGIVTSSVLSKVLFVRRSEESVEANLLQMARNGAVQNDADTIVRGASERFGERTFALYQCRF